MSIKKLGEDDLRKFRECKTEDDYRGFVSGLGLELSSEDLDSVCGGLAELESTEAFNALSKRLGSSAIARDGRVLMDANAVDGILRKSDDR